MARKKALEMSARIVQIAQYFLVIMSTKRLQMTSSNSVDYWCENQGPVERFFFCYPKAFFKLASSCFSDKNPELLPHNIFPKLWNRVEKAEKGEKSLENFSRKGVCCQNLTRILTWLERTGRCQGSCEDATPRSIHLGFMEGKVGSSSSTQGQCTGRGFWNGLVSFGLGLLLSHLWSSVFSFTKYGLSAPNIMVIQSFRIS